MPGAKHNSHPQVLDVPQRSVRQGSPSVVANTVNARQGSSVSEDGHIPIDVIGEEEEGEREVNE